MSHIFKLLLVLVLYSTCTPSYMLKVPIDPDLETPNGIRIDSVRYIDRSEVRNVDWKEYQYWTKRIFGKNSPEYMYTIPDTAVWYGTVVNDTFLVENYYRSPLYDDSPMIGITAAQAYKFSRWRADRVFEMMLIYKSILEPSTSNQTADSYFSIEKYLNGDYRTKPDTSIHFYPMYRLPTKEEIKEIETLHHSSMKSYYDNCRTDICKDCLLKSKMLKPSQVIDNNISVYGSPYKPAGEDCIDASTFDYYHIYSNAGEMLSNGEVIGYRWDNLATGKEQDLFSSNMGASVSLGFRNMCEWREIDWNNLESMIY